MRSTAPTSSPPASQKRASMVDRIVWPEEDTHIFMTNGVRFELRDGYSVDEVVGQGAYGMVCSGAYRGRPVAVKVRARLVVGRRGGWVCVCVCVCCLQYP